MAQMERISVTAFTELAAQLASFGAPQGLIQRCFEAAADEQLHDQFLTRLAAAHGATFAGEAETIDSGVELLEIATHNAVEGCVNEAWAALLATHQASNAQHPVLRSSQG